MKDQSKEFILSGEKNWQEVGEERILRQGDGFFVPSGVSHGCQCLEEGMLIDVFAPMREDFV